MGLPFGIDRLPGFLWDDATGSWRFLTGQEDAHTLTHEVTHTSGEDKSPAPNTVTAVGKPFAGAKGWLVGFGALAVIITLMTDSPQWQGVGYALLVLIIVSYVFASFDQIRSEGNALFGTRL